MSTPPSSPPPPAPPRGFRGRLASFKPAHAAGLALLLTLPALAAGYGADDLVMRCELGAAGCPDVRLRWAPWDLFRFYDGTAALARARREIGYAPWWLLDEMKISFFRPIASLSHAFDWAVFGDRPWLMHAHSVLWYALLAFLAASVYRRLIGPTWAAGLAALLYAVEDAHGVPAGWLSARNSLCAAAFGLLALGAYARWRERGSRAAACLAHAALAGALLSAEGGVAAFVYLAAYALTLDRAPPRDRLLALLPAAAIVAAWRLGWQAAGYGTFGGDYYADPLREPVAYARAASERLPPLLFGQFTISVLGDLWSLLSPRARLALWVAGLAVTAGAVRLFAPLVRRDPRARFFALGAIGSCALVAGVIPTDRLMVHAGFGAQGLLALWLAEAADSPRRRARAGAAALAVLHVGVSGLMLPVRTLTLRVLSARGTKVAVAAPLGGLRRDQTVVVLATPSATMLGLMPFLRGANGLPAPDRLYTLVNGCSPAEITRVDARTLRVRAEGGWAASGAAVGGPPARNVLDREFRGVRFPSRVGERVELDAMQVEVTGVTADGLPAEALFRFRDVLESDAYRWLAWDDGLHPSAPPAEGATRAVRMPCPAGPL